MTEIHRTIVCAECGEQLPDTWILDEDASQPCSNCGSNKQKITINVNEDATIEVHDQMKAKLKDKSLPSKKKVRKEVIAGDDERVSRGDWVEKHRVIDRDNDVYIERVVDKKTGEVIRDVSESLAKHLGHGSDKPKK